MTNVQKVWLNLVIGILAPLIIVIGLALFMQALGKYGWMVPVVIITGAVVVVIIFIMRVALVSARKADAAKHIESEGE